MKLKLTLLSLTLLLTLQSCAQPVAGIDRRIRELKSRGIDTSMLERELKAQENKFALFRTYKLSDEMLAGLEMGKDVSPTSVSVDHQTFCFRRFEDPAHNVICYAYCEGGIWCEHMINR